MDVLKMVEEALVMACGTFRSHAGEEQRAYECTAALTALRGLAWKPIAEMANPEPMTCRVGRYLESGAWDMNDLRNGTYAAACGYTHFCRPILPTPPKREVE
jgi:hypothetical protein